MTRAWKVAVAKVNNLLSQPDWYLNFGGIFIDPIEPRLGTSQTIRVD